VALFTIAWLNAPSRWHHFSINQPRALLLGCAIENVTPRWIHQSETARADQINGRDWMLTTPSIIFADCCHTSVPVMLVLGKKGLFPCLVYLVASQLSHRCWPNVVQASKGAGQDTQSTTIGDNDTAIDVGASPGAQP